MIVIRPSRGAGVTIGSQVTLFNNVFEDSGGARCYVVLVPSSPTNPDNIPYARMVVGAPVITSGPSSPYEYLYSGGDSSLYEVYCQPTSGSVSTFYPYASSAVNTWLNLGSQRRWYRQSFGDVTMTLSIRDVATHTVQATCTITLKA